MSAQKSRRQHRARPSDQTTTLVQPEALGADLSSELGEQVIIDGLTEDDDAIAALVFGVLRNNRASGQNIQAPPHDLQVP